VTSEPASPQPLAPPAGAINWPRDAAVACGLAILTLILFAQVRQFDFVGFDDPFYVTRNPRVLQGLSLSNIRWAFTTLTLSNWHPLTWLAHMSDVQFFGLDAGDHHLVSVFIHGINAAVLYLLLTALTASPGKSALVAALFAVHPLRMESVAWISERKDVLSGLFFLLTIAAYARFARTSRTIWYWTTLAAFVVGMMAKPMLVTLPFVLLLLDFWPLRRIEARNWRQRVIEKIPFLVLSLVASAITYVAQHLGGAMGEQKDYPLALRAGNAVLGCGRYLRKTVWPSDLAVFYPYHGMLRGTRFPWGGAVISAVAVIIITALLLRLWRTERAALVGWLLFLGMLVPTIGLVQVGSQSMADRYTYLPHIGLFIAAIWGVDAALRGRATLRTAMAAAGWLAVLIFAICTASQLHYWQNTETLFNRALAVTDHNSTAHVALANWLGRAGRQSDAAQHFLAALEMDPTHPEANNNLGNILAANGRDDLALARFRQAVRAQPRYAEAHNNLANMLAKQGKLDEAIVHHQAAVRLDPELPQAHFNYGVTLASSGRLSEAIQSFERALRLRPEYPDARYAYALALSAKGDAVKALEQLGEAIRQRPDWPQPINSAAWLLATSADARVRNPAQAVSLAERVSQMTGFDDPGMLDTLATAYAAAGRFENAVTVAERARQLAAARGLTDLAAQLAHRLELYRAAKPFIDNRNAVDGRAGATSNPASNPDNSSR
jgi:tetratricopeptide (TPR) repeat protein